MSVMITAHTPLFGTAPQASPDDMAKIKAEGYQTVINNRPDFEGGPDQPTSEAMQLAAQAIGLNYIAQPFSPSQVSQALVVEFAQLVGNAPKPVLAFCRTGTRSTNIYQAAMSMGLLNPKDLTLVADQTNGMAEKKTSEILNSTEVHAASLSRQTRIHDIVIVGGGSGGIAIAASLLKRQPDLDIAIIEPSDLHYYQPAWTLVGAGEFDVHQSVKQMHAVMPAKAKWIKSAAAAFQPELNILTLDTGEMISYNQLIIAMGLVCAWDAIPGLVETLGQNGVTSNYRYDLAPYTWGCVRKLKSGTALFTQPLGSIKCAEAPQNALYLSAAHWQKKTRLNNIHIEFHNASATLFKVPDFIPNLSAQMMAYNAQVNLCSQLVQVDGPNQKAWFEYKDEEGQFVRTEKSFDMLHVVPPQRPHASLANSLLADKDGWIEVDHASLQHKRYPNIFSVGDAISAPNSKTAAAIRKQVVVVAENLMALRAKRTLPMAYDGYSACPITVGHGRLILAEFGYGDKLMPTFGTDPIVPRQYGWYMKKFLFPWLYWNLMLKGHEWLARPQHIKKA